MEKIYIKGKEYNLKYTIRSLFIFENITKKPFKVETLLDNYIFFYSMILANNKENPLDWDDFIDALDDDPTLYTRISEIVTKEQKHNEIFEDEEKDDGEEKKS